MGGQTRRSLWRTTCVGCARGPSASVARTWGLSTPRTRPASPWPTTLVSLSSLSVASPSNSRPSRSSLNATSVQASVPPSLPTTPPPTSSPGNPNTSVPTSRPPSHTTYDLQYDTTPDSDDLSNPY